MRGGVTVGRGVTVVVAGVAGVAQTVPVDGFPVHYVPVRYPRHGLRLEVAGVGLNVARVLRALGTSVSLAALVGRDPAGLLVRAELTRLGLLGGDQTAGGDLSADGGPAIGSGVLEVGSTPTSVVLVEPGGARQVNTDLKDLPDAEYPATVFNALLAGARLAVVSTIGFARPLLTMARSAGVPVAVDVQTVGGVDDACLRPWLEAADVLFCSAERLGTDPATFAADVLKRFPARIIVVGMGADGCLLGIRGQAVRRFPAIAPHGVVDTTGAGDALFAGFLHYWLATGDAAMAADHAVLVAGCAVGTPGAGTHVDAGHIADLRTRTR
ncbi:carbohydrate kinase family protein [Frankia canadensis]|uniref:carbohydrate kinase family protein n=1 Tax=Frankia canadensis TaxID=1836972 RepID=UPI001FAEE31E|nr:carbohydrate kinase family protein [Frankia canadensis]